jgi:hypothetical protein
MPLSRRPALQVLRSKALHRSSQRHRHQGRSRNATLSFHPFACRIHLRGNGTELGARVRRDEVQARRAGMMMQGLRAPYIERRRARRMARGSRRGSRMEELLYRWRLPVEGCTSHGQRRDERGPLASGTNTDSKPFFHNIVMAEYAVICLRVGAPRRTKDPRARCLSWRGCRLLLSLLLTSLLLERRERLTGISDENDS